MAGKHRKPTPTKRNVARAATIGVTVVSASSLSLPFGHAADANVWDRIADCESSGDWSIDTGNGYSGGLQFSPSTWREFGGNEFSTEAADATQSEQIEVATRVQKVQGWEAWPVCSKEANATGAPPALADLQDDDATQTAPDRDERSSTADSAPSPSSAAYIVAEGDTLGDIAARMNVTDLDGLARASGIVDPDVILPGQRIVLPGSQSSTQSRSSSSDTSNVPDNASGSTGDQAVSEARTWSGVDYVWGGESRSGADCSGLVQSVYEEVGVDLPRTANEQMNATERISRSELRPGDLLFDVNSSGRATHVGIYTGDDRQIDAPRSGSTVGERAIYDDQTVYGRIS